MDDFTKSMLLNIQNENFEFTNISVQEARECFDSGDIPEDFVNKLDEAQAKVFSGEHDTTLLIVVITKE